MIPHAKLSAPPSRDSSAEHRKPARWGALLFRNRGWLPVPFILVPLLLPGHATVAQWAVGTVFAIGGEAIRLAGVAAAGTVTRRRSRDVQRLVTYGAFAWTRNPLYVGNLLLWTGVVIVSGVFWFLPVAILLFVAEYSLIVSYEEGVLESIFGAAYLQYKRTTPRWLPRPPRRRAAGSYDWKEAWRSETSTFAACAVLAAAFAVKGLLT